MSNTPLTQEQVERYWADGYVFVDNALTPSQLAALVDDFESWVEESRHHAAPWGDTMAGRARFDLAPEHSRADPRLRRVASPVEVSDAYRDAMRDNRALDAVAQLIRASTQH